MAWGNQMSGVAELEPPDAPLVSIDDFAEAHQVPVPISPEDQARIQTAIQIATGIIRAETRGMVFTPMAGDVVTVNGTGGRLLKLPGELLPISDVTTVVEDGTELDSDAFTWDAAGVLEKTSGRRWTTTRRGVLVTCDHGYQVLPQGIVGVCLSLAKRWLDSPAGQQVVQAETIGSYSVTYSDAGGVGLTELESSVIGKAVAPR